MLAYAWVSTHKAEYAFVRSTGILIQGFSLDKDTVTTLDAKYRLLSSLDSR